MNRKFILSVAVGLMFGVSSTVFAAVFPFRDVSPYHWGFDAVAQIAVDGIVQPYSDGTFRGDRNTTRYDMAIMAANMLKKQLGDVDAESDIHFTDVPEGHKAYKALELLAAYEIIKPDKDGNFRGDDDITRYETAVVLANYLFKTSGIKFATTKYYIDVPKDEEAYNAVMTMAETNIMPGYSDNTFRGDMTVTRYEMAKIIAKTLYR